MANKTVVLKNEQNLQIHDGYFKRWLTKWLFLKINKIYKSMMAILKDGYNKMVVLKNKQNLKIHDGYFKRWLTKWLFLKINKIYKSMVAILKDDQQNGCS